MDDATRGAPADRGACFCAGGAAAQQGQVNVICSVQADWCNMIQTVYREDHRRQGQHVAEGLGRGAGAADRREGEPEDRRLVRRHRRPAPAGGRAGPDARIQVADACRSCTPGRSSRPQQSGYRTVGIYSGPLGFGYNTELLAKKKLRRAAELGRPAQARVQGRDPGGQPGLQRHRVHDDRHAGAADGRGQGLRLPEGAAPQRRPVHPLGHRRRSRRWRAARPRSRSASCTTGRARRCRASRSRRSRRPKAPAPRSAR